MILTGTGLFYAVWSYSQGRPRYVPMVIYVVITLYLNQRDVQQLFQQEADLELTP